MLCQQFGGVVGQGVCCGGEEGGGGKWVLNTLRVYSGAALLTGKVPGPGRWHPSAPFLPLGVTPLAQPHNGSGPTPQAAGSISGWIENSTGGFLEDEAVAHSQGEEL